MTPGTFPDGEAIRRDVGSSAAGRAHVDRIPELDEPLEATKLVSIFVARTAS